MTLIVGTEKGAFLCRPDAIEGPLFKGWRVTATARTNTGRYVAATASEVYGPAMHVSDDLKEWRQVENGPSYAEGEEAMGWQGGELQKVPRKMKQVWTLTASDGRVWAGVDSAGLFTSDDDGETWQPVTALNEHETRSHWFPGAGGLCAHAVLVRGERIWVGVSAAGVWRSDDGGASWQAKNRGVRKMVPDKEFEEIGFCVHGLAQDPDDENAIYRQDHAGVYRTRDGGDTWEAAENGLPSADVGPGKATKASFGFPIAMDPKSKHLYVVPLESDEYRLPRDGKFRVYRSRDAADSWEELA